MHWSHISVFLGKSAEYIGVGSLLLIAAVGIRRRRAVHSEGLHAYKQAVVNDMAEPISLHPYIDPVRCAGCGACVKACPEGEILQMIDHKAVLVAPTKCVGHGQCEVACPFGAISLVFGTKTRGMDLPRITSDFETNVKGLYIVGELGGMGLIRNAVKQGRMAVEHAVQHLSSGTKADCDILIVGAGAAGLSAALAAIAAKRPYKCIDQNSVGGTIFNFPRQKVVMSQPATLPIVGTMKFPRNKVTKEELLAYWSMVRRRTGLKVREGCRFISLRKEGELFLTETTQGVIKAKKVVLAMGVRGTPRKLDVPGEDLAKVTYNLLEPEQYQRMHVAVIGGGNAAVEAAQMLAKPELRNKVTILVRTPGFNRANQENIDILQSMAARKLVTIMFNTFVTRIERDFLAIEANGIASRLPNQFIFIFAGAEMPFAFLQSLGIKIDKKFGEARKRS